MNESSVGSRIEIQINEIEREISQPGWSVWALLASLAATFWILASFLKDFHGRISDALVIAISLYLLLSLILPLFLRSNNVTYRSDHIYIKLSNSIWGSSKRTFSFELATSVIFAVAVPSLKSSEFVAQYSIWFFGIQSLLVFLMVLVSISRVPYVVNQTKSHPVFNSVFLFLIIGSNLYIGLALFVPYALQFVYWLSEIQLGSLFAILAIIAYYTLKQSRPNPLLENLRQLRHDLAFALVDDKEAAERLELILFGLRVEQYVEKDLKAVLGTYHEISELYSKVDKYFDLIVNPLPDVDLNQRTTVRDAASAAIRLILDETQKLLAALSTQERRLRMKIGGLKGQSRSVLEFEKIETEMSQRQKAMVDQIREFTARLQEHTSQAQLDFSERRQIGDAG